MFKSKFNPKYVRIIGLVGAIATGLFTILSTGDLVTGAGIIMAGFSTVGVQNAE